MEMFKAALVVMAFDEMQREREHHGQYRQMTPEEVGTLADFGWHLPDVKSSLAACAYAIRIRLRPRAHHRLDPTPRPSPTAAAQA